MVYVKFSLEEHQELLNTLKIDLNQFKHGLVPFQTVKQNLDKANACISSSKDSQKLFLHEIVTAEMICLEGHKNALDIAAAENDPAVVRQREERAARINERRFQDEVNREKAKSQGIFGGGDIREMEKSMSFGVSFIFTFFLSGISGYYLGKLFFGLNDGLSMILAVVALIGTLILESTLFIMKTWKNDKVHLKRQQEAADAKAAARRMQTNDINQLIREYQNAKPKPPTDKKND